MAGVRLSSERRSGCAVAVDDRAAEFGRRAPEVTRVAASMLVDDGAQAPSSLPRSQWLGALVAGIALGGAMVSAAIAQMAHSDQATVAQAGLDGQPGVEPAATLEALIDVPFSEVEMIWVPPAGPLGGPNAYNVVADANFRAMLGDALIRSIPALNAVLLALEARADRERERWANRTDSLPQHLRVVFPDGSNVVYSFRRGDSTATFRSDSAMTAAGQAIPDPQTANSPVGTGYWSAVGPNGGHEDLQRFLAYMRSRGARIVDDGDAGSNRGVTCRWDGKVLECARGA